MRDKSGPGSKMLRLRRIAGVIKTNLIVKLYCLHITHCTEYFMGYMLDFIFAKLLYNSKYNVAHSSRLPYYICKETICPR